MNKEQNLDPAETAEVVAQTTALSKIDNPPPALVEKQPITATQAKIDAIADLTHSAYARAGTLDLTKEESEALQLDFLDEAFKPGADGKEHLIYIEHAYLRNRLTEVFGMGKWAIVPRRSWSEKFILPANKTRSETEGERVYVEAMLIIRGCFVAEAIGDMAYYPKNNAQNYGDAVEGAKTAALRRCCKEFGIGLQAWKKDFCQGWADRTREKSRSPLLNRPPVKPLSRDPDPAPKPEPKKPSGIDDRYREKMIKEILAGPEMANRKVVQEYFKKLGQIIPTETVEDLPLRFVPSTKEEMDSMVSCIIAFQDGSEAVSAFDPHGEADVTPKVPRGTKPVEVPREAVARKSDVAGVADDEMWYDVIVPIPHKGQKRDDYLKNPDTIGSLYDARHDDEDARKRLWGMVNHYEPKGWTKRDGTEMPASKSDHEFRAALDQFNDWFEATHPDERL